ncbi:Carnitine O-acetyltransferase, partial [Acropora cervicornis]
IVKFASPVMVKTSASGVTKPFGMLAKQDSLPPLPVPALQQTMEKYLSAIKPLVDEEEFEYTQDLVKDFLKPNGDGEHLQNKLIQKAKTETNWVSINATLSSLRCGVSFTDKMDHLKYAARVISTVLKFKELIDNEAIPVEMMGKNPLCMIQYLKLLGSCRIPQPVRDHVVVAPKGMSKHVIVAYKKEPPPHSTQSPSVMERPTWSVTARQCLHGDGTQYNSANRWFDKIIQVCISEDGHSGICYEHSAAEGPPVAALCNYILENLGNHQEIAPSVVQHLETPAKLKWNLTNKLKEAIQQSASELDRIHNHNPPTYETGSTRKFLLGRTDTIRSASIASSNFVKAMVSPNKTNAEKLDLMKKAIKAHTHYTQEAVNGQAIDRHLLGLKLAALESRMNLPELFMDSSYQYALHYKLSTSQVPSNHELFLSFGPAVPDGYGVCYNPQKNKIILGVSTVNSNPETNPGHFAAYLQRSLDEMQLLAKTSKL